MVRRLIEFLSRDVLGLHNAAYLLACSMVLSQLLGLVRDRLLASSFGAGSMLDVYYASFRIPDFIFVSVSSLLSVSVLIPFLIDRLEDKERLRQFINSVFSVFAFLIVIVATAAFFAAPRLVSFLFPGFDADLERQTIELSRILLLSPLLLGLSNLAGSVVQVYRKFLLYAVSPLLYNIGIIVGITLLYPLYGLPGLAWGVVLGTFLHLFIQLPFLLGRGLAPRFSFNFDFSAVRELLLVSLPRSLSLSLQQLTVIALTLFASSMGAGAIAVFNFSWNLQSVPLSIIAVSYSVAAFPVLSKLFVSGERDEFLRHVTIAARHIIFWSTPALIFFIVLRAQLVRTVLGAGAFDWTDTRLTAAALAFFVVSLLPQGLSLLFARGYYAAGNTRIPLLSALVSVAATAFFAFGLTYLFSASALFRHFIESLLRVEDLPGTVVLMLPLSYSIGMAVNALMLFILFERRFAPVSLPLGRTFFHSFSASVLGGAACYLALSVLPLYFNLNTFVGVFLQGLIAGIFGLTVLVLTLIVLKNEEFLEIREALKRRFSTAKIIGSETTQL